MAQENENKLFGNTETPRVPSDGLFRAIPVPDSELPQGSSTNFQARAVVTLEDGSKAQTRNVATAQVPATAPSTTDAVVTTVPPIYVGTPTGSNSSSNVSKVLAIREILGIYIHSKALIYSLSVKTASNTYGTGDKFHINNVDCPPLTLFRGKTYIFELNDSSLNNKIFTFFTNAKIPGENKFNRNVSKYTKGVTYYGTSSTNNAYLIFVVPEDAPDRLYYDILDDTQAGYGNVVYIKSIVIPPKITTTLAVPDLRFPDDELHKSDPPAVKCAEDGECVKPIGDGRRSDIRYRIPDSQFLEPVKQTTESPTTQPPATTTEPATTFPPDENPYEAVSYPAHKIYEVKVASATNWAGAGNKYIIKKNGFAQVSPSLFLEQGKTYIFDQSDPSNHNHPLRFSETTDGTHQGGKELRFNVKTFGVPGTAGAYSEIKISFSRDLSSATLYYYCKHHSGMGQYLKVVAAPNREDIEIKPDPNDFSVTVDPSVAVSGYDDYMSYKFSQSATMVVEYTGIKPFVNPTLDVEYLLVGGGGGGGQPGAGGGGGAGAVASGVTKLSAGTYNLIVGLSTPPANNGNPTTFNFIVADGGGAGRYLGGTTFTTKGSSGGAAGNSNERILPISADIGNDLIVNVGGSSLSDTFTGGGGGGGAGQAGASVAQDPEGRYIGGKGGNGVSTSYYGNISETFAAGGGGGGSGVLLSGSGGSGGGGGSSSKDGVDGTGSGGAGATITAGLYPGDLIGRMDAGRGGRGVAYLRYNKVVEPIYNSNYKDALKILGVFQNGKNVTLMWEPSNSTNSVERYFIRYKNITSLSFSSEDYFYTDSNTTTGTFTFPDYGVYDVAVSVDGDRNAFLGPITTINLIDVSVTPKISSPSVTDGLLSISLSDNVYDQGFIRISYDNVNWEYFDIRKNQSFLYIPVRLANTSTKLYIQSGTNLPDGQQHLFENVETVDYISDSDDPAIDPPTNLVKTSCTKDKISTFQFTKNPKATNTIVKITNVISDLVETRNIDGNTFDVFPTVLSDYQHNFFAANILYTADGSNGVKIYTFDPSDKSLTQSAAFSWDDTTTKKCFAKHVTLFNVLGVKHLSVTSNDQVVILNVNDLSNVSLVARYEAVGADKSVVLPPNNTLIVTDNGLLKYYDISTITTSDTLVTNPSSFNIGSTDACELIQAANFSPSANTFNNKFFVLESDSVIEYEINTSTRNLTKTSEQPVTNPLAASVANEAGAPPINDFLITNSNNIIQICDRSTDSVLGSYTLSEQILFHSVSPSTNSYTFYVLTVEKFYKFTYDPSTYAITLSDQVDVDIINNQGNFNIDNTASYAFVTTEHRIFIITLSDFSSVETFDQQVYERFRIEMASENDLGIGEFADFGLFSHCSVPIPESEECFFTITSHKILPSDSVIIYGYPSCEDTGGYIVNCPDRNNVPTSKRVPLPPPDGGILVDDIYPEGENTVCIQSITDKGVHSRKACVVVDFPSHNPPDAPTGLAFDNDPPNNYLHEVVWDNVDDSEVQYKAIVTYYQDGVFKYSEDYDIGYSFSTFVVDGVTYNRYKFSDKGGSKRHGTWVIKFDLVAFNNAGDSPSASTNKTISVSLELKPPKRYTVSPSLMIITASWEKPSNLNEFDKLIGYDLVLIGPNGNSSSFYVPPERSTKSINVTMSGTYQLTIQAQASINDIVYSSPILFRYVTIDDAALPDDDEGGGGGKPPTPTLVDLCQIEPSQIRITINESSSETKSHMVKVTHQTIGSEVFTRLIPATFTAGVATINCGMQQNVQHSFSVYSLVSGSVSNNSSIKSIIGAPPRIPKVPVVDFYYADILSAHFNFENYHEQDYGWSTTCFSAPDEEVSTVVSYKKSIDSTWTTFTTEKGKFKTKISTHGLIPNVEYLFKFAVKNDAYISDFTQVYAIVPLGEETIGDDGGAGGGGGGNDPPEDGVTFWYKRDAIARIRYDLSPDKKLVVMPHVQLPHSLGQLFLENSIDEDFIQPEVNQSLINSSLFVGEGFMYRSCLGQAGKMPVKIVPNNDYTDEEGNLVVVPTSVSIEDRQIFNASTKVVSGYNSVINFIPIVLDVAVAGDGKSSTVTFTPGAYDSEVDRYELRMSNGTTYDFNSKSIVLDHGNNDQLSFIAIGYDIKNQRVIESEQTFVNSPVEFPERLTDVSTSFDMVDDQDYFRVKGRFNISELQRKSFYSFGSVNVNEKGVVDLIGLGYFPIGPYHPDAKRINDLDVMGERYYSVSDESITSLMGILNNRSPKDAFSPINGKFGDAIIKSNPIYKLQAIEENDGKYSPQAIEFGKFDELLAPTETSNEAHNKYLVVSVMMMRNDKNQYGALYKVSLVDTDNYYLACDGSSSAGISCRDREYIVTKGAGDHLLSNAFSTLEQCEERKILAYTDYPDIPIGDDLYDEMCAGTTTTTPPTTTSAPETTSGPETTTPAPDPTTSSPTTATPTTTTAAPPDFPFPFPGPSPADGCTAYNLGTFSSWNPFKTPNNVQLLQISKNGATKTLGSTNSGYNTYVTDGIYFDPVMEVNYQVGINFDYQSDSISPVNIEEISAFNLGEHEIISRLSSESAARHATFRAVKSQAAFQHSYNLYVGRFFMPNDDSSAAELVEFYIQYGTFLSTDNVFYAYYFFSKSFTQDEIIRAQAYPANSAGDPQNAGRPGNVDYFGGLNIARQLAFTECTDLPVFNLNGQSGYGFGYKYVNSENFRLEASLVMLSSQTSNRWINLQESEYRYIPNASSNVTMNIHNVGCFLGDMDCALPDSGDRFEILVFKDNHSDQGGIHYNIPVTYGYTSDGENYLFMHHGGYGWAYPKDISFDPTEGVISFAYEASADCWDGTFNNDIRFRLGINDTQRHVVPEGDPSDFTGARILSVTEYNDFTFRNLTTVKNIELYDHDRLIEENLNSSLITGGYYYKYTLSDDSFFFWDATPPSLTPEGRWFYKTTTRFSIVHMPRREKILYAGMEVFIEASARDVSLAGLTYVNNISATGGQGNWREYVLFRLTLKDN